MQIVDLPINTITVNHRRRAIRQSAVEDLVESIAQIGLLQPVTVNEDFSLIAGLHRLEAVKRLEWQTIPAHVKAMAELDAELAEIDENLKRNELTALEQGEHLARRKEIYEAQHGKPVDVTKTGGPGRGNKTGDTMSPVLSFTENTSAKTGITKRTVQRDVKIGRDIAEDVRDAIRDTPVADQKTELLKLAQMPTEKQKEVAKKLVTGKAKSVKDADRQMKQEERRDLAIKAPSGKYAVIYADPPWQYDNSGFDESAESQYPTMPTDDICAMRPMLDEWATDETVLFMWATNPLLPDALRVMSAWGFTYKTNMAWVKDKGRGKGWFLKSKHELLLIGTKRNTPQPKQRHDSAVEAARPSTHSKKPEVFYEIIEAMYDGAKLEMFCRATRHGWEAHGNQL